MKYNPVDEAINLLKKAIEKQKDAQEDKGIHSCGEQCEYYKYANVPFDVKPYKMCALIELEIAIKVFQRKMKRGKK